MKKEIDLEKIADIILNHLSEDDAKFEILLLLKSYQKNEPKLFEGLYGDFFPYSKEV